MRFLASLAIRKTSNGPFFNELILVFNGLQIDSCVLFLCFKIPDSVKQKLDFVICSQQIPFLSHFYLFFGGIITVLHSVFKNNKEIFCYKVPICLLIFCITLTIHGQHSKRLKFLIELSFPSLRFTLHFKKRILKD